MKNRNLHGSYLLEIMIVVAIISLLAAIVIPNFVRARTISHKNQCVGYLKEIRWAKEAWFSANSTPKPSQSLDQTNMLAWADLVGPGKALSAKPTCPAGGEYSINAFNTNPSCSYRSSADWHADHVLRR